MTKKAELNAEMVKEIEDHVADLLQDFSVKMNDCSSETEYINLIISTMIYKNLIIAQFKMLLKEDGVKDSKIIIKELEQTALAISKEVEKRNALPVISKEMMN